MYSSSSGSGVHPNHLLSSMWYLDSDNSDESENLFEPRARPSCMWSFDSDNRAGHITEVGSSSEDSESELMPLGRNYSFVEPEVNSELEQETFVIGDLDSITDNREFSLKTYIAKVQFIKSRTKSWFNFPKPPTWKINWTKEYESFKWEEFSERKILFLIHGFTVGYDSALKTLQRVSEKVAHTYDVVIAYLYPAYAKPHEYPYAEKNAIRAGKERLPKILKSLRPIAKQLDIAAHSMGTIVAMYALNQKASPKIDNLFLLGGAVEEKSLFECDGVECTSFPRALSNARNIYVLYSCKDQVLPWLRLLARAQPVGRIDEEIQHRPIAKNACLIHTSSVVKNHSAYFKTEEVFKFFTLVAHHISQGTAIKGPYFSLTSDELSFLLGPIVCSKGGNSIITTGLLFKRIVSFRPGKIGKSRNKAKA
ncbi:Uncharacterized protein PHSC3_000426 [Chlamydiales bacterium STE3]|nr:Uncharacterized protein PHSC3_000426 [Chlamydiales bacterium STE3]